MKNTIKRILKEESLKQELKDEVKEYGWESAASLVGGADVLADIAFNNDPMEFLNMYNDMEIIHDKRWENGVFFGYGDIKLIYYDNRGTAFIDQMVIWDPLYNVFKLKWDDITKVTKTWLSSAYKLKLESTSNFNVRRGFNY